MLKAGALIYTIGICLVIGILSSALILYSYYSRLEFLEYQLIEKVSLNANSGISLLLSNPGFAAIGETKTIDLFGEGGDSVKLERKTWGIFEVAVSEAFRKSIRSKKSALIGYRSDTSSALYLADRDKPLSLCGKVIIRGNCALPKAGVKRAYIEGQNFVGDKMIDGTVTSSEKNVPEMNKELIAQVQKITNDTYPDKDTVCLIDEKGIPDTLIRGFDKKTLFLVSNTAIRITNQHISGNVIIVSGKSITVGGDARLQDIILIARGILVQEKFTGAVQAFGTDSVVLEAGVSLTYPSVIGLIKETSSVQNPAIKIGENASVSGVLFAYQSTYDNRNQVKINIAKDAVIEGLVYSNGLVDLKGSIYGSLYASGLILSTPSSVYENHLLNATIDVTKLSPHFLGLNLVSKTDKSGIVKWLY
ncbi:MAG: hypothetical protein HY840_06530 [Bacteroidetes bacterium]|nr:hypothetical protein [Bacteroidota bacterium]